MTTRAPEGVPESRGLNLFEADPSFRGLLELHLEPALAAHLMPHFERLGALAGAELDEMALAHTVSDATEAAYRRGDLFEKRRRLMAEWAKHCDNIKHTGKVISLARN